MKRRGENGSAVLVVITFTIVISALLIANAMAIHQLRQELRRVERKQVERLQSPTGK